MGFNTSGVVLNKSNALSIWDAEELPPVDGVKTILWQNFGDGVSHDVISMPSLVEENADALRRQYLSWVYDLGETQIQGQRLVDHLELGSGFSYWWMTLFVEKCNYGKSPQIDDVIKLMALDRWFVGQSIRHVVLITSNEPLAECIRAWCAKLGVEFEWQQLLSKKEPVRWIKRLYRSLPPVLQALVWLGLYLLQRWPLKGVGLREWRQTEGRLAFVSYLFNLTDDAVNIGRFESNYWGNLPNELQCDGLKTNWLHIYVKDASLPSASKAAAAIRKLNQTGLGAQTHITLDAFLTLRLAFRAVSDWVCIRRKGEGLEAAIAAEQQTVMNLWPLFKRDWHRSFTGTEALINLLNVNLLKAALQALPAQQIGVYLQENQGWEFSLIHAWRSAGHGRLIGAPHSTIRFWDLRYFFDPRSYDKSERNQLPLPDKVALNGSLALDAYLAASYPEHNLVVVEALRYLHLASFGAKMPRVSRPSGAPLRVLVLGDYRSQNTKKQMRLLNRAAHLLPSDTVFTIKPHPACPVEPEDYPSIRMTVTMISLQSLLTDCDVAYTSNVTSAAVDSYCAGVPVVSILDPSTLNLSPLRGRDGAVFVGTPEALADALISRASSRPLLDRQRPFFELDPMLPRWRKLLLA